MSSLTANPVSLTWIGRPRKQSWVQLSGYFPPSIENKFGSNASSFFSSSSPQGLTVLQVEQTRLTNVFHFTAGLTDFRLLETHASARTPPEHSKGPGTDLMWELRTACLVLISTNA